MKMRHNNHNCQSTTTTTMVLLPYTVFQTIVLCILLIFSNPIPVYSFISTPAIDRRRIRSITTMTFRSSRSRCRRQSQEWVGGDGLRLIRNDDSTFSTPPLDKNVMVRGGEEERTMMMTTTPNYSVTNDISKDDQTSFVSFQSSLLSFMPIKWFHNKNVPSSQQSSSDGGVLSLLPFLIVFGIVGFSDSSWAATTDIVVDASSTGTTSTQLEGTSLKIGEFVFYAYIGFSTLAGVKGVYDAFQRKSNDASKEEK